MAIPLPPGTKLKVGIWNGETKWWADYEVAYSTAFFRGLPPRALVLAGLGRKSSLLQVQPNQLPDLCSLDQARRSAEAYAVSMGERQTVVAKGAAQISSKETSNN